VKKATLGNVVAPDLCRRIDAEMLGFLRAEAERLEPEALPLLDELEALISAGGKRLRPRFCVLGHLACGGTDEGPIGCRDRLGLWEKNEGIDAGALA
jgi:geranylgeranyl pyrophosphate synthase